MSSHNNTRQGAALAKQAAAKVLKARNAIENAMADTTAPPWTPAQKQTLQAAFNMLNGAYGACTTAAERLVGI